MSSRAAERINFGKIKEIITPPNLIELQTNSYVEFLQINVAPTRRKNVGLQAVFKEVFPIEQASTVIDWHANLAAKTFDDIEFDHWSSFR